MQFLPLTFKMYFFTFNASLLLLALPQIIGINNLVHDHLTGNFQGHVNSLKSAFT